MSGLRLSRTQVDLLGDRLRGSQYDEEDLRFLNEYRRTFGPAYDVVVGAAQAVLGSPISGRPAKSTTAIIEKLTRETMRLTQMQDIAGCRVVLGDTLEQQRAIMAIQDAFPGCTVVDRRVNPSYGYRAVHVIIDIEGKPIEVQIRSGLQHLWAELSEKFADVIDPAVKYGGGPENVRDSLRRVSYIIEDIEDAETLESFRRDPDASRRLGELRLEMAELVKTAIEEVTRLQLEQSDNDLSN